MKTLAIATLGLVLAGTSVTALAGSQDREHLTQCKNAVIRVLGEDTDVKLKGIKRVRGGAHMRIRAVPVGGDSEMLTCWVDKSGITNIHDSAGVAMNIPAYDVGDKVSLND